jgi:tRNA(Ile)-lysidine synthase
VDHNHPVTSTPEARVAEHCRRHALLPPGEPVLAMVSGGPDSTCLMHLLRALHDGPIGVLAIDHGLRPESADECEAVVSAARALGLAAHVARLGMRPGAGVQERARDLRIAAAEECAAAEGYARIATGHTGSDAAETVLFRLARGTGRTGALGIAPRRGRHIRPLLPLDADETRFWCAARGLPVATDPSNADPRFARSRVREGLLPALGAVHPSAARHVAAFAERLRDEAALLAPLEEAAWARAHDGGGLLVAALVREPEAMGRILVRRLISGAGLPGDALGAAPLARVLRLLDGSGRVGLPGGGSAAIERGRLVIAGPRVAPPAPVPLGIPGSVGFGRFAVSAREGVGAAPIPGSVAVRPDGPLTVRGPLPGDRLPLRGGGHVAVGRLLASAGVPARERERVPVVATPGRVVWVAGHRAADDLLVTDRGPAVILEMEVV